MKKIFVILSLVILSLLLLASCNTGSHFERKEKSDITVMLVTDAGATVTSEASVTVKEGEEARFSVTLGDTFVLSSLTAGRLENADGEESDGTGEKELFVSVSGIEKSSVVKLTTEDLGYSTAVEYRVFHYLNEKDSASVSNKASVNAGTRLSFSATRSDLKFIGWSIGSPTLFKDDCMSAEREISFRISPELVDKNGVLRIYSNYVERNSLIYDLNGGYLDTSTNQAKTNDYYQSNSASGRLKLLYSADYLSVFESPALFYDDGTFSRTGYILTEYNTKPDGSGKGYSLGSRMYIDTDSDEVELLYCIWTKESDPYDFKYTDYSYPLPATTSAKKAPDWKEEGIIITSYLGDDDVIAVPDMIDGKYVIAIAEGAFENRSAKTLVLPRHIQLIERRAFVGCSSIETFYYPDSIYLMYNESFDEASYTSLKHLYVNATMAPRHSNTDSGAFAVKLSRLLADDGKKKIVMIAGSSAYQGFSSEYMEALLGGEYRVINFGTTRTTNGVIYLEAMHAFLNEGDIVLYAPENSTYMMGECELYWKTLRDMEALYNFYRYIDISEYDNVFGAFSDYNINYRYVRNPSTYEASYEVITEKGSVNEYGEYQNAKRVSLVSNYVDTYFLTFNKRYKSKLDLEWNDENQSANKDYNDPSNVTWQSIDTPYLVYHMNRCIKSAQQSGAKVYFSFCPSDADKLVSEARDLEWLLAYDALIADLYEFDGVLGSCVDYIFAHEYFYDCAFHPNDLGRTYRTYQVYLDLCDLFGKEARDYTSVGTNFEGCIFVDRGTYSPDGKPKTKVDYLLDETE